MFYLIDGYNLLFSSHGSIKNLASERHLLIAYLQNRFASLQLKGLLVFDGKHRRDEESGLSYKSPLDIAYTPKGQNADCFIVEKIESARNPKEMRVVTNDRGLSLHSRSAGASVQSNTAFLAFLIKKRAKKMRNQFVSETPQNMERLLKIFTERLEENTPDQ